MFSVLLPWAQWLLKRPWLEEGINKITHPEVDSRQLGLMTCTYRLQSKKKKLGHKTSPVMLELVRQDIQDYCLCYLLMNHVEPVGSL